MELHPRQAGTETVRKSRAAVCGVVRDEFRQLAGSAGSGPSANMSSRMVTKMKAAAPIRHPAHLRQASAAPVMTDACACGRKDWPSSDQRNPTPGCPADLKASRRRCVRSGRYDVGTASAREQNSPSSAGSLGGCVI